MRVVVRVRNQDEGDGDGDDAHGQGRAVNERWLDSVVEVKYSIV